MLYALSFQAGDANARILHLAADVKISIWSLLSLLQAIN